MKLDDQRRWRRDDDFTVPHNPVGDDPDSLVEDTQPPVLDGTRGSVLKVVAAGVKNRFRPSELYLRLGVTADSKI